MYDRERYLRNRERHVQHVMEYQKRNPEKFKEWRDKYKAKIYDEKVANGFIPRKDHPKKIIVRKPRIFKLNEVSIRDIYTKTKTAKEYAILYGVHPDTVRNVWDEVHYKNIIEKIKQEGLKKD